MTREEARTTKEVHELGDDGNCVADGKPYPCPELAEALGVIGGMVAAT